MNNYEVNKKLGVNKPIKNDFKACLNDLTKDKIEAYSKNYGLKGLSKLKKGDLIDKFYEAFITEKALVATLDALNGKDFELIEKLMENKVEDITDYNLPDYLNLFVTALAFIYIEDNRMKMVMADEVIEVIKTVDMTDIHSGAEEADELENYLNSFVELYGVLNVDFFVNRFNEYTGKNLSSSYIVDLFKMNDNTIGYAYLQDGYIMSQAIGSFEGDLEDLLNSRVKGDFKILDKDLLLKYGDDLDFIEMTPAHEVFLEAIDAVTKDKEVALDIIFELHTTFTMDKYDIYEILGHVDQFADIEKAPKNLIDDILKQSIVVFDNTRRWENKGFTNIELKELKAANPVIKVGRNETCPCGSGKKYKKCCINKESISIK